MDKGEQLAWVWRSKARCNPLFIATGHRVSMDSALAWVQRCMKGYRLPEPTRWADAVASRVRLLFVGRKFSDDSGKLRLIFDSRIIMLQNPIHLRLEKLESWQHVTFMACLCERMYPNYAAFCKQTGFGDGHIYRRILDLIWETLTVKDAKVNFDSQLEKLEEAIPVADDFDLYGVYPAIDACVALSELIHSRLSGETLEHAIEVSKASITTVAMLEMTQEGREMTDEELRANPAVEQEWDIQWEIFRLLAECEERDIELIKGLRADLREAGESNIGIIFNQ
jgi:uncharacterized protein YjaG (DUF416 family)